METTHESVLLEEVMEMMSIPQTGETVIVVDGTLGGAGHASALLERNANVFLIGFDQDQSALERARQRLSASSDRIYLSRGNFIDLEQLLDSVPAEIFEKLTSGTGGRVHRILLDLGISSHQLDDPDRGFSFRADGPLDMRMNREEGRTAADVLNESSPRELERIFLRGGLKSPLPRKIAAEVVRRRPLETTHQFAEVCRKATPPSREGKPKDPSTVPFQALRMEVNRELEAIESVLPQAFQELCALGKLLVISFHSLEDQAVARTMREWTREGRLPPGVPVRGEERTAGRLLTPAAIVPSEEEKGRNPRARSARMRVFEKSAAVVEERR